MPLPRIRALHTLTGQGWRLPIAAIRQGFTRVQWPGRFEIVNQSPYVVLDGAHNRYSAKKLNQALHTYFPEADVVLLFGASEDKDIPAIFAEFTARRGHIGAGTGRTPPGDFRRSIGGNGSGL